MPVQLATLQLVTYQLATLTTRHHYNSSPWRICLDQSLYFDYFLLQCLRYTAPRIFNSIPVFCRFFVRINEIQHLLLHFNYVIFIYIKIVILYWRNVMVAKYNGGEIKGWRDVIVASCKVASCKVASCKVASCQVASCTGIILWFTEHCFWGTKDLASGK
jgi:hypothetical protein